MSELTNAAEAFRRQLAAQFVDATSELARAYAQAQRRILAELDALYASGVSAFDVTPSVGDSIIASSVEALLRRDRLRALLAQVNRELERLGAQAADLTEAMQLEAAQAAQVHADELMRIAALQSDSPLLIGTFNRLPTSAVSEFVGLASEGSPLRRLFRSISETSWRAIQETLEQALALGINPRTTAQQLRQQFGLSYRRALTIARTEQLRAYREVSFRTYAANDDVLDGWVWLSGADAVCCAACLAMHGTWHPLTERMASHPNCRCTMLPAVRGARIALRSGESIFASMSLEEQQDKIGKAAAQAYRDGVVRLGDFAGIRRNSVWGDSVRVRSLREVLGEDEAQRFIERVRRSRQRA